MPNTANRRRCSRQLLGVAATVFALAGVGCSSTFTRDRHPQPLDFEVADLRDGLKNVGHPRGTNLIVEISEKDLPPGKAREFFRQDQYRATMYVSGDAQVWRTGPHEVVFEDGRFHVGPFSYTPARYGRLYVFKERTGDFTFLFHGHRIIVEADGRWTPAIYYSVENVTPEGTPVHEINRPGGRAKGATGNLRTRYVGPSFPVETLHMGRRRLVVDSRNGSWSLDKRPVTPGDMILEGVVPFAAP